MAAQHIRVNGNLVNPKGVTLRPNDRICIGPSAIFLFKHKAKEQDASMPDPEDDPISFDWAENEVSQVENKQEQQEKEAQRKAQQEENEHALKTLQDELAKARDKAQGDIKQREEDLQALIASGDTDAVEALKKQIEAMKVKFSQDEAERQKQMEAETRRRKAMELEYSRVEKQLNHLLPLVNEANLASTELKRNLKFQTKIVKKLDPFGSGGKLVGKVEILIKVDNAEDNYYYEWSADKFQNRVFMIREVLEEYFDSGDLPKLSKDEDPFWDPPNPILIGQSFLQLEPLGSGFPNYPDKGVSILSIDGAGGRQGVLFIGYSPCDKNGNTDESLLPEEFLVDDPTELIGLKDMYFKVNIKHAKDLPSKLNCNPFVTYQFKSERNILYTCDELQGLQSNPNWNYSRLHKFDYISPNIAEDLKTGCICFQVYAYPPARAQMSKNDGGQAALKRRQTIIGNKVGAKAEAKLLG